MRRRSSRRTHAAAALAALAPVLALAQGEPERLPPAQAPGTPAPATAPAPAADDEEERASADRALERALVQKGGLLVRKWRLELVPEVAFAYSDGNSPPAASRVGSPFGARTELFSGRLTLRLGLPLALQVEASAPLVYVRLTPGGEDAAARPAEGWGLGDVRLGATWHMIRGRARVPDVLVGGFWKSRSGRTPLDDPAEDVPFGTGVEQFGGTLAIVKAVDPVVLLVTGNYAVSAPRWIPAGWLEAGDEFGGSAGAVLAVSPETSLSFAIEAEHARPFELDGQTVFRSDRTSALFRVGVATLTARRAFLQVNVGMGLTRDVPQFEVTLATPFQL